MWLDPSNTAIGVSLVGGTDITGKRDSFDLSISSVGASYAGRYTCVVTGGGAEQRNTSDLIVQCKEDTCWESHCASGCLCGEVVYEVLWSPYTEIQCLHEPCN